MSIKIEIEKALSADGTKIKKITKIECLPKEKLPSIYLKKNKPTVFLKDNKDLICWGIIKYTIHYRIGVSYELGEIDKLIAHCKKAGERLRKCNEYLKKRKELSKKKERKKWTGKEVYII